MGFCIFVSSASAEDVAIRYQVINISQDVTADIWTLKLEIQNLTGEELNNLAVGLLTPLSSISSEDRVAVGKFPTTHPRIAVADFTVPVEYTPSNDSPIKFFVDYETTDGSRISAVVQGQPAVFVGEMSP